MSSPNSKMLNLQTNPSQPKRPNTTQHSPFDAAPLWSYVTVIKLPSSGGGNRVWICNYCNKKVTGSYTKVKGHLLHLRGHGVELCVSISDQTKEELLREHQSAETRKAKQAMKAKRKLEFVSLPSGSDLKQQKKKKGTVEACFNVVDRDEVDKEMARMIYASALPFSLVKNAYFRRFCLRLSNSKIAGYVPPTYNRIRTSLLEQEKTQVNFLLQPFRDSWKKKGVSLCSDGWGDRQKRPLINVMAASGGSSMFVKSVDTSGNIKDAEYVAGLFLNVIDQLGADNMVQIITDNAGNFKDNMVQIITDNAGNFKAAGLSIEARYAHIFWTPCVVHSLNLALKSMCEPNVKASHYENCKWILNLIFDCDDIVMFILNHGKALTIYQNHSQHMLVKTAEIRFASHVIMAQRLLLVKNALEKTVLDPNWKTFRKTNLESKADHVNECVISDRWWDKLEYFVAFTSPIYNMIRLADMDTPCLHLVYDMWDTMIEEVREKNFKEEGQDLKNGESEFFNDIHNILETRWNKSNTPLHCMAHSLVPKYYSEAWLQVGGGIVSRVAPNEDHEISQNRNKCFKKMFTNPDDLRKINAEYAMFSGTLGFFF